MQLFTDFLLTIHLQYICKCEKTKKQNVFIVADTILWKYLEKNMYMNLV